MVVQPKLYPTGAKRAMRRKSQWPGPFNGCDQDTSQRFWKNLEGSPGTRPFFGIAHSKGLAWGVCATAHSKEVSARDPGTAHFEGVSERAGEKDRKNGEENPETLAPGRGKIQKWRDLGSRRGCSVRFTQDDSTRC